MALQLTTALRAGDMDPGAPVGEYTHCLATLLGNYPNERAPFLRLAISFGYYVDGSYIRGAVLPGGRVDVYDIAGADYVDLVTNATPLPGENTYAAAKRGIYEHLISKAVIPPGEVV